jgi:hypothetical protein
VAQRSQVPFAEAAAELLADLGWSESEAARRIGLDRSFFRKALRGSDYKRLAPEHIAALSEAAGLSREYFPEVREAAVVDAVRSDPGLRDRLFDELGLER